MPNFETGIWFGLMAPAGTPRDIIEKLAKAVPEAMDASEAATRAAHPRPRAPRRRPRRVRALHRHRDRQVGRGGTGRGAEEVASIYVFSRATSSSQRRISRRERKPHPTRIAQFLEAPPALVIGPPGPADRVVGGEQHIPALAVAVPQLGTGRRTADRAPDHLGHDLPARHVEPHDGRRPFPDELAHRGVIAVDDPALAVDDRGDPSAKLGIGKRDPVRLVNDRVRAR